MTRAIPYSQAHPHSNWARTMSRKQREAEQQAAAMAAITNARDWGRDYFRRFPELLLIEVSREGSARFDHNDQIVAFLQGYIEARTHHNAFKRGE